MIVFDIETERCKGCKLCVLVCPSGCLKINQKIINSQGFNPVEYNCVGNKGNCTACGICYLTCPDYAIVTIKKRIKRRANNAV